MRATRLVVALAVTAGGFAALPAHAAPEHPLAGTTTITAARSSSLDVVMNNDAVIRLRPDGTTRDVTLHGPGRMVAFSMTFQGNATDSLRAVRTTFGGKQQTDTEINGTVYPQSTSCDTTDVPSVPGVYDGCTPAYRVPKYVVLHQGRYHVRVLTDGGPLTVTLQLHGLTGSTALRTSKPLASSVEPLNKLDVIADRYARAQAQIVVTATSDLIYRANANETAGARLHSSSTCLYDGADTLPTDYAPGCPMGTGSGSSWVYTDRSVTPTGVGGGYAWFGGWDPITPGSFRFGLGIGSDTGVAYRGGWVGLLQGEG